VQANGRNLDIVARLKKGNFYKDIRLGSEFGVFL